MTKPTGSTYADALQALKNVVKQDASKCKAWGKVYPYTDQERIYGFTSLYHRKGEL